MIPGHIRRRHILEKYGIACFMYVPPMSDDILRYRYPMKSTGARSARVADPTIYLVKKA